MKQGQLLGLGARARSYCAVGALALSACRLEVEPPLVDFDDDDNEADLSAQRRAATPPVQWWNLPPEPVPELPDAPVAAQPPAPERVPEPDELPVQLYAPLIVIDPAIVGGTLGANTADAPFGFRTQMTWLAGAAQTPFDFTRDWLLEWASASSVGPELAPVAPRRGATDLLLAGWLEASSTGAAYDSGGEASWAEAPFRLIAIVNRIDLADDPCRGFAGELRYVYAALDAHTQEPLELTLILEVPYPATRTAADWARAWTELRGLPKSQLPAGLARIAEAVRLDADPLRARLRSNEIALAEPGTEPSWELREFHPVVRDGALALEPAVLEFTPRDDVDPAQLSEHVLAHAEEIRAGAVSLPQELRAGVARTPSASFSWPVLGVSESLRRAFSRETCNGCHGGDTPAAPFQHIAPDASLKRPAHLSRFLNDPDSDSDELRRRRARLDELASSQCPPREQSSAYPAPSEPAPNELH